MNPISCELQSELDSLKRTADHRCCPLFDTSIQELAGCDADESSNTTKIVIPGVAAVIAFDSAIFVLTIIRVGRYSKSRALLGLFVYLCFPTTGREGQDGGRIVNIFFRDGEHCVRPNDHALLNLSIRSYILRCYVA